MIFLHVYLKGFQLRPGKRKCWHDVNHQSLDHTVNPIHAGADLVTVTVVCSHDQDGSTIAYSAFQAALFCQKQSR